MITCIITSRKQIIVYRYVQSVGLPAFYGYMQILPMHAESFVLLRKGEISIRFAELQNKSDIQQTKRSKIIPIATGECHIKDDVVTIIVD